MLENSILKVDWVNELSKPVVQVWAYAIMKNHSKLFIRILCYTYSSLCLWLLELLAASSRIWVSLSSWGIPFIVIFLLLSPWGTSGFPWELSGINAEESTTLDASKCGPVLLKFLSSVLLMTPSFIVIPVSSDATCTFFQKQRILVNLL